MVEWSAFRGPHLQRGTEFKLWKQSGRLHPVAQRLEAGKGGTVATLGDRWTLGFPGDGVQSDVTVTLAEAEHPRTHSGDRLHVDPDLDAGNPVTVAVGLEFKLRVKRAKGGGDGAPPSLEGPVVVTAFYESREAAPLAAR